MNIPRAVTAENKQQVADKLRELADMIEHGPDTLYQDVMWAVLRTAEWNLIAPGKGT